MSDPTTERIMKFLAGPKYRPQKVRALARSMGIEEDEYSEFRDSVKALMASGRIVLGGGNAVCLPRASNEIIGTFRAKAQGFGFVIPESPNEFGDLYVPQGETLGALTGDTVKAKILRKGRRGENMLYEGRVVEILLRGNSQFVGELRQEMGRWFVWPDGNTLNAPIEIADVTAKSAKAGDQVVVEITEYPKGSMPARGVLVKRLGVRGEAGVAIRSIICQYNLPEEFPADVLEETRRVIQNYDPDREATRREDLRKVVTFTIDPDDARDYDDAISLQRTGRNTFELGVHIADVSAFVKPGSRLDEEAKKRGNSIYFPGYVLPMLPEVLSNGLCSLQEGQPRLVKSAFIQIDAKGRPAGTRFANSIIQSQKRLTYTQAQSILDGKTGGYPPAVVEALKQMDTLAKTIRKRRLADGMLVLDLPEVELTLDDNGNVVGAQPADTSFTHTLIEMFMVEANEAVARLFAKMGVPHIRRIHPEPDTQTGERLTTYLKAMGMKIPKALTREYMQEVLDATRGRPEGFAIHMAILRSFEQAIYSPKNIGHFALASEDYCHFTSPIRRYPDLVIHRLLEQYLDGRLESKKDRRDAPPFSQLVELGEHCSFTERRAVDAEREIRKVLVLHHLEKRLGDEFDGVVTGVANIGVFVQLPEFLIDGLIRFAALPDDWWELDQRRGMLVGQRSGRKIQIGNRLRVAISRINIASREMDLDLIEQHRPRQQQVQRPAQKQPPHRGKAKPRKEQPQGRRGRRRGRR